MLDKWPLNSKHRFNLQHLYSCISKIFFISADSNGVYVFFAIGEHFEQIHRISEPIIFKYLLPNKNGGIWTGSTNTLTAPGYSNIQQMYSLRSTCCPQHSGVQALAGRAPSVGFPGNLEFHRANPSEGTLFPFRGPRIVVNQAPGGKILIFK